MPSRDGAAVARRGLAAGSGARCRAAPRLRGEAHGAARSRRRHPPAACAGTGVSGGHPLVLACLLLLARRRRRGGLAGSRRRAAPPVARSAFGTEPGGHIETAVARLRRPASSAGHRLLAASTSWLFMSLDDGSWSGEATCQVRLADGTTVPLGHVLARERLRSLGRRLPPGPATSDSASVVTAEGVLASAHLAARRSATARSRRPAGRRPRGGLDVQRLGRDGAGSSCREPDAQPRSSSSSPRASGSSSSTPASIASTTSRGSWSSSCSSS